LKNYKTFLFAYFYLNMR